VFANVLAASANIEKPIENVSSWVFTAVRNRIIDSYRKKRAENFSDLQTPEQAEEGVDPFENFVSDYYNTPGNRLFEKNYMGIYTRRTIRITERTKRCFIRNDLTASHSEKWQKKQVLISITLLAESVMLCCI